MAPLLRAAAAALALALAGCESTGALQMRQPRAAPIESNRIVALNVIAANTADAQAALRDVGLHLFGLLTTSGRFAAVVTPTDAAHYDLDVYLSDAKIVTKGGQALRGAFGHAHALTAEVRLTDRIAKQTVTAFRARGESASNPLSDQSGLDDAVRELGQQVLNGLL